jgi:hypothetical protein
LSTSFRPDSYLPFDFILFPKIVKTFPEIGMVGAEEEAALAVKQVQAGES